MCLCEIHSPTVIAQHAKTFAINGENENEERKKTNKMQQLDVYY